MCLLLCVRKQLVCICVLIDSIQVTHLVDSHRELGPALPVRTLVSLLESGLFGVPAAVLVVEPEAVQTHTLFQVC